MPKHILNNAITVADNRTYFKRAYIHELLAKSIQKPVVMVVSGIGYGKTQTVYMFLQEYEAVNIWLQLTMLDNLGARFWENLVNAISLANIKLANNLDMLGFPDTVAKFELFLSYMLENTDASRKHVIVFDDFHLLHENKLLQFIEKFIDAGLANFSFIIISRSEPQINTASLLAKNMVAVINENDLCFSRDEIVRYYETQGIYILQSLVSDIYDNTGGWIIAIRLIELSIKKGVWHPEYAVSAMKANIYKMMDSEIYARLAPKTQIFLVKLSLFDSLPMELVEELAAHSKTLIKAIAQINSFIRADSLANIYYIQQLFLEFLRQKCDILTAEEQAECYKKAANWYAGKGYIIDAITNYGKAQDYEGILKIALISPHASAEEGALVLSILDEKRKDILDWEPRIALLHAQAQWFVGRIEEFMAETQAIIKACEALPQTPENCSTLAELYISTGLSYYYLANYTNDFHFTDYFERAYSLLKCASIPMNIDFGFQDVGAYVCRISGRKKEDVEAYVEAVHTAAYHAEKMIPGCMCGIYDLTQAELFYFKNSLKEAGKAAYKALHIAREHHQHAIAARSIFYLLRVSLAEGNYVELQYYLHQLDLQFEIENTPINRTLYDTLTGWAYSLIKQPDKVPGWLKNNFEPVEISRMVSGFEDLAKIKYYQCEKKYYELLTFLEIQENISDIRSFIFGKILIATTKAICLYRTNQKDKALVELRAAYNLAAPNAFIMQFIEMGNDMVALTKFALKSPDCGIPEDWLQDLRKKSSTYAKRLSQITAEYKQDNQPEEESAIQLTRKELELLTDLFHGLSRAEIATNYNLSPNYVKNRLQAIYAKLGAENANDAIRIALLRRLI